MIKTPNCKHKSFQVQLSNSPWDYKSHSFPSNRKRSFCAGFPLEMEWREGGNRPQQLTNWEVLCVSRVADLVVESGGVTVLAQILSGPTERGQSGRGLPG